jgi:hypothetical protein
MLLVRLRLANNSNVMGSLHGILEISSILVRTKVDSGVPEKRKQVPSNAMDCSSSLSGDFLGGEVAESVGGSHGK